MPALSIDWGTAVTANSSVSLQLAGKTEKNSPFYKLLFYPKDMSRFFLLKNTACSWAFFHSYQPYRYMVILFCSVICLVFCPYQKGMGYLSEITKDILFDGLLSLLSLLNPSWNSRPCSGWSKQHFLHQNMTKSIPKTQKPIKHLRCRDK